MKTLKRGLLFSALIGASTAGPVGGCIASDTRRCYSISFAIALDRVLGKSRFVPFAMISPPQAFFFNLVVALLLSKPPGLLVCSAEPAPQQEPYHRYVVVGAGPGGLQLAHFLHSAQRDYVILDSAARPGSFFRSYPRMRQLISINKRIGSDAGDVALDYAMRHDWNSLLTEPSHSSSQTRHLFEMAPWRCPGHAAAGADVNATCFAPAASSSDPRIKLGSAPPRTLFRDFSSDFYPHADSLVAYLEHFAGPNSQRSRLPTCAVQPQGNHLCDAVGAADADAHEGEPLRIRPNTTVLKVAAHPAWAAAAAKGMTEAACIAAGVPRFLLTLQARHGDGAEGEQQQQLAATFLVWAAGLQSTPRSESPGVQAALDAQWPGVYTYSTAPTDMAAYANKTVLVVGRGNAAFELANSMLEVAARVHVVGRYPRRVRLSLETHYPGDVRLLHARLLETYLLKSLDGMLEANLPAMTLRRTPSGRFNFSPHDGEATSTGRNEGSDTSVCRRDAWGRDTNQACAVFTFEYDAVISCAGWKLDTSPFDAAVRPELTATGKHPATTPLFESVNVPGLYFAGTLMHGRDAKRSSGGFIHGFRYLVRALHRHLEEVEASALAQVHGLSATRAHSGSGSSDTSVSALAPIRDTAMLWPRRQLRGLRHAAHALLERINVAAGPYQMFGQLADVIVLPPLQLPPAIAQEEGKTSFGGHGVRAAGDEPWSFPDAATPGTYLAQALPPWNMPPSRLGAQGHEGADDGLDSDSDPLGVGEHVPDSHIHDNGGLSAYSFRRDAAQSAADESIDRALRGGLLLEEVPVAAIPDKARAWCEQAAAAGATAAASSATAADMPAGRLHSMAVTSSVACTGGLPVEFVTLTLEYGGAHAPPYLQPAEGGAVQGPGLQQHYSDLPRSTPAGEHTASFAGHDTPAAPPSRVLDPFSTARVNGSVADAQFSTFLHPVLRFYHTALWQQQPGKAGEDASQHTAGAPPAAALHGKQHAGHAPPLPPPALEVHLLEDFYVAFTSHTSHVLAVTRFLQDVGARRVQAALAAAAQQRQQQEFMPSESSEAADSIAADAAAVAATSCTAEGNAACSHSADAPMQHALAAIWQSQVEGSPVLSAGLPALGQDGAPDARADLLLQLLTPRRSALYLHGTGVAGGHAWFHRLSRAAADSMLGYSNAAGVAGDAGPHALLLHVVDPFPSPPTDGTAGSDGFSSALSPEAAAVLRARLTRLRRFHASCSARLRGLAPLVVMLARGEEEAAAVAGAAGALATPHAALWLPRCGWQRLPVFASDPNSSDVPKDCAAQPRSPASYTQTASALEAAVVDGPLPLYPSCSMQGGLADESCHSFHTALQEESMMIAHGHVETGLLPDTRSIDAFGKPVECQQGSCHDSHPLPLPPTDETPSDQLRYHQEHLRHGEPSVSLGLSSSPAHFADHDSGFEPTGAPSSLSWRDDERTDVELQRMCDSSVAMLQQLAAMQRQGAKPGVN